MVYEGIIRENGNGDSPDSGLSLIHAFGILFFFLQK